MLKLGAAVLTADRIDFWIRRHVIQYCCETPIANSPENFAVNTASRIARRTRARAIFIGMYSHNDQHRHWLEANIGVP
jgi:hypothetical protein